MIERVIYKAANCAGCTSPLTFCKNMVAGRFEFRLQCSKCLKLAGRKVTKDMAKYYDLHTKEIPRYQRPDGRRLRNPDVVRSGPQPVDEIRRLQLLPYLEYLKTEHWKQVRNMALAQAGNRCQLCNNDRSLQVHHRTYERVGHEDLKDLTVLCGKCHRAFHGK